MDGQRGLATEEIGQRYDDLAPSYDRIDRLFEATIVGRLRRLFEQAHGELLEVAIGTGKNLPYYPSDCRVTGVDVSAGMLAQARRRAATLGIDPTLAVMDAERLEFPDASFDTVTSSLTTCTFVDPLAALREMGRVCRLGGRILLLEHGRSSNRALGWVQDVAAERHARACGCHWNREPQDLVRQAGLEIIEARRKLFGVYHTIVAAPAPRREA